MPKHNDLLESLRGMDEEQLAEALSQERRKLYDLRTRNVVKQLDNTAAISHAKKQIARLLTLQKERELAAKG